MIAYRELMDDELDPSLFAHFRRYQEVTRCRRRENGLWVIRDIAFTEEWDENDYRTLCACLRGTIAGHGGVFAAFSEDGLIGFASVEGKRFGPGEEYVQLSSLHVSYGLRGGGIGRHLFQLAAERARALGARKLYISSHSAVETQAFYKAMGCVEARHYDPTLTAAEPCDCQLEYLL